MRRRRVLAALVGVFSFLLVTTQAEPASPKPHVVCAVVAFLIVGPTSKPAQVLGQQVLRFVPCPPVKGSSTRAPAA